MQWTALDAVSLQNDRCSYIVPCSGLAAESCHKLGQIVMYAACDAISLRNWQHQFLSVPTMQAEPHIWRGGSTSCYWVGGQSAYLAQQQVWYYA